MNAESQQEALEIFRGGRAQPKTGFLPKDLKAADTDEEASCRAYGFLRGLREKAHMLELRFKNGNTEALAYHLLHSMRFNPSYGVLLRFGGDITTMVMISGSNLDVVLKDMEVNLTDRGIQRQRITWVREMDEDELRKLKPSDPSIDAIAVGECESEETVQTWMGQNAKGFARNSVPVL
ncbi:hypothetical protein KIH39_18320 [Telmatocola sphagniphila]|uniref:Uncharacterized protein n=1 Tax=Telmatocola sphagniphila TaxID=1123043 RepID=A0A8E6B2N3_9BACT|nr:hypothetical protein [Telmatocola sphagniphila]QVL30793.1 hypothetical protein KIH39_18320 [Telmatocola sphagniphila]